MTREWDPHLVPNEGGFVESILRSSANPSGWSSSDPDSFLDDLIQQTSNIIHIQILTPFPAEVHPELLKKHNVLFLTTKWSGENDLEKFETWIYDLVLWLLSSRWKGPTYNEQQVSALMQTLEGEPKLIVIHNNKEGYERGHEVLFLEHLTKLMHMYIKRLAAVPSTKLFKTLSYDSSKGIKSLYTQLLHVSEKMITCPDQATFNECFINTLPSHFKEELVMCDKISVNFSLREEIWQVVLWLDHAYDSLRAINTYCSANHQRVNHPPTNLANKLLNQTGQLTSMNKQNNFHYSKFNNQKNNNKPPMQTNRLPGACQGTSKTGSVHNIQVPAELRCIYEGSLKGNGSLLNAWVEVL